MASTDLYKQLQKTFLTETGLGIGDRVKVLTTASMGHLGWDVMWVPDMNWAVGETVTIEEISPSMGLLLRWKDGSNGRAYFPFFVLEKAEAVKEPEKPKTFSFRNGLEAYRTITGNELFISDYRVTGDMLETIRRILSGAGKTLKPYAVAKSKSGFIAPFGLADYITKKLQAIPEDVFFTGYFGKSYSINSFSFESNGVLNDVELWNYFDDMFSIEWRSEYSISNIAGYNVTVYEAESKYIRIGCKDFYFDELERFLLWAEGDNKDEHASSI